MKSEANQVRELISSIRKEVHQSASTQKKQFHASSFGAIYTKLRKAFYHFGQDVAWLSLAIVSWALWSKLISGVISVAKTLTPPGFLLLVFICGVIDFLLPRSGNRIIKFVLLGILASIPLSRLLYK